MNRIRQVLSNAGFLAANRENGRITMPAVDRRTQYTKMVISESFFSLLKEKGFSKITVAEICKAAQINRGTFYLHYEDKYALLNEVIDAALDEGFVEGTLPEALCQRVPKTAHARLLYEDMDTFPYVAKRMIERSEPVVVPVIMERAGLSKAEARVLFVYAAHGNLAVNQLMGWSDSDEYAAAQRLVERFVGGGFQALAAGSGKDGEKGGAR